jgi:hypothetical protein
VTGFAPNSYVIGYLIDLNQIEGMLEAVNVDVPIRNLSKPQNLKEFSDLIKVVSFETGTINQIVNFYMDEFLAVNIERTPEIGSIYSNDSIKMSFKS